MWLDVNQGGANHNRCTQRLIIFRAQTYYNEPWLAWPTLRVKIMRRKKWAWMYAFSRQLSLTAHWMLVSCVRSNTTARKVTKCTIEDDVPYLTWQMSPTSRSLTGTWSTSPPLIVANLCSCSILFWSPRNCRSLRQSLNAVTSTTTTTATRIAIPSIHSACDSESSCSTSVQAITRRIPVLSACEWAAGQRPTRRVKSHFGDKSSQTIDCTGTDSQIHNSQKKCT